MTSRHRLLGAGPLLGTLVALGGLAGCAVATSAADGIPVDQRAMADCRAFIPYPDLETWAAAFAKEPSMSGWVGGDIAADTRLSNGQTIFAFGDTIVDTMAAATPTVRNSLLAFDEDRSCLVLGPEGQAFVPDRPDGIGYWPTSVVQAAPDGAITLFLQRVSGSAIEGETFTNLGPSLAEVVLDEFEVPHVARVIDIGPDDASRQRIGWGAASWVADDGYVYVYGTSNPELRMIFGWSLHVARATPDHVADPQTWEYWNGTAWVRDPASAVPLIPAEGGVSQTLSVFEHEGTWYAVSKRDDFLGDDVVIWTAPGPMGPFRVAGPVASRPSDPGAGVITYAALAHPTLFPEDGTIVVSVSQNTTDRSALVEDPTLYRPEFFRVPLPTP